MIRVLLCGAAGRMGTEIVTALSNADDLRLVGAVEAVDHPAIGTRVGATTITADLSALASTGDVVLDFTLPGPACEHARIAAEHGIPFVTGTTGFSAREEEDLRAAAEKIPLLWASNMSRGITAARRVVETMVRSLPDYDVEIIEMHHRRKVDAPSGTALKLAETVREVRDDLRVQHGRAGAVGPREDAELGMHALRGGDVVGEHHVILAGPGERLILTHIADSRAAFVAGALAALRFLPRRPPGLYTMDDLLSGD